MKFCLKHQGSISLFMILILLPVFIFSSFVIDGTRAFSVANYVSGAGDLAMNAALSDFNVDLNNVYGLLAATDDAEKLSDNLKKYITDMVEKKAWPELEEGGDTKKLVNELCSKIFSPEYTDSPDNIVGITLDDLDFNANYVSTSALGNPTIMANQIVQYMKYRAPLVIGQGLLSKFSQFKGIGKQLDAVNAETGYKLAVAEMGDSLENCYRFTEAYLAYVNDIYNTPGVLTIFEDDVNNILKGADDTIFGYLMVINAPELDTMKHYNADEENHYEIVENDLRRSITEFQLAREQLTDEVADRIDGRIDSEYDEEPSVDDYVNALELIQAVLQSGNYLVFDDHGTVKDKSGILFDLYDKVVNKNVDEMANPEIQRTLAYMNYMCDEEKAKKIIKGLNICHAYVRIYDYYAAAEETDKIDNKIKSKAEILKKYVDSFNKFGKTVDSKTVQNELASFEANNVKNYFTRRVKEIMQIRISSVVNYKKVVNAEYYLQGVLYWLGKVEEDVANINEKKTTWEEKITAMDDSETKSNFAAREKTETQKLDQEQLNNFKTLIENSKNSLNKIKAEYEKYSISSNKCYSGSYASGYKPGLIYDKYPSDFKECQAEVIDPKTGTFKDNAAIGVMKFDYHKSQFKSEEDMYLYKVDSGEKICNWYRDNITHGSVYQYTYATLKSKASDLNRQYVTLPKFKDNAELSGWKLEVFTDGSENSKFYEYMKQCFDESGRPGKDDEEVKNSKKGLSSMLDNTSQPKTEEKVNNIPSSDVSAIYNKINDIAKGGSGSPFSDQGMDGIKEGDGKDGDKKKYKDTANNAMNLVSTATEFVKQIGNIATAERDILYIASYALANFSCATTNYKPAGDMLSKHELDAKDFKQNLAGYPMDPYNNYAYRGELEYILWGKPDIKANVTQTKTIVYGIRFALNTIYAFTAPEVQNVTHPTAALITSALPFLEPLVNVILTLAFSAAESAIDLNNLMNGNPEAVYKNTTTWHLSLSGAWSAVMDSTKAFVQEKATEVIEDVFTKIENFASNKVEDLTKIATDYTNETAESIKQSVKGNVITPIINALTDTVNTYLDQSDLRPQLTNAAKNAIQALSNNISGDSAIAKAERAVLDSLDDAAIETYFVGPIMTVVNTPYDSASKRITELKNKMEGIADNVINGLSDKITGILSDINDELQTEMKEAFNSGKEKVKDKASQAIDNYMQKVTGIVPDNKTTTNTPIKGAEQSAAVSSTIKLTYEEYVTAFLIVGIQFESSRKEMLKRMAVLIEMNMTKTADGTSSTKPINKKSGVDMSKAFTMVKLNVNYHFNTLFLDLNADTIDVTDWKLGDNDGVTMNYSSIMGY